jgi:hypothetical protein
MSEKFKLGHYQVFKQVSSARQAENNLVLKALSE